jgi:hypothetical protein
MFIFNSECDFAYLSTNGTPVNTMVHKFYSTLHLLFIAYPDDVKACSMLTLRLVVSDVLILSLVYLV